MKQSIYHTKDGTNSQLVNGKNSFVNINNINTAIELIIDEVNPDTNGLVVFEDVKLNNLYEILNSYGVAFDDNLPLVMTKNHVYLDVRESGILKGNYHNVGIYNFIDAIYKINEPIIVFHDKNSFVVVVNVVDHHNNTIIIPIRIKENIHNSTIEANIILSIYGKKGFTSFIKNKLLIYEKK